MNVNVKEVMTEFTKASEKLVKGYETLQRIKDVEVATTPKTLVWQRDHVKVYHYNRETPAKCKIPCLVSFAMINRQDVLDIQPDRSLMKKLLDEGLDVYIIDWGYPGKQDRYLTMEDYILGYLDDAVDYVRKANKAPKINMLAICQGGTFSMIYASLKPEKFNTLTTFVAPFDFKGNECMLYRWTKDIDVDAMVDSIGTIPGSMLDQGFGFLKPSMNISKYLGVMDSLEDEEKLLSFLRMEKWKADLPNIAGEMFRKYIKDLFRDNKLIKGEMELGGHKVDLKNMTVPYLNVYATEDNIIPNTSTLPVMDKIGTTDKTAYPFKGGHIGVFVGSKSQKELGPAVAKWIMDRS